MARKPKVIVGSSTEALRSAAQLQRLLAPDVDAQLWDEGLFPPGEFTLESLETRASDYDGAVLVGSADDRVLTRGSAFSSPRDNIILEFGLFVATLGRRRALLLVERDETIKLPSDVAGLTVLTFRPAQRASASLRDAAVKIMDVATDWTEPLVGPDVRARLDRVLQIWLGEVQLRAGIESDLGMHAFVVDRRATPPELVRLARARSNPKAKTPWPPFRKGSGVVGWCWACSDAVFVDLTSPPYSNATSAEWRRLSPSERVGMQFSQLEKSRQRYKCVGAVPMPTEALEDKFIGCLSYNLGVDSSARPDALRSPDVKRLLDSCAELLALVIGRTS